MTKKDELIQTIKEKINEGINKWLDDVLYEGSRNLEWVDDVVWDHLGEIGLESRDIFTYETHDTVMTTVRYIEFPTDSDAEKFLIAVRDDVETQLIADIPHPIRYASDLVIDPELPVGERYSLYQIVRETWKSVFSDRSVVDEWRNSHKWRTVCEKVSSAIKRRIQREIEDTHKELLDASLTDLVEYLWEIVDDYHKGAVDTVEAFLIAEGKGVISSENINKVLSALDEVHQTTTQYFKQMLKVVPNLNLREVSPVNNPRQTIAHYTTGISKVMVTVLELLGYMKSTSVWEEYEREKEVERVIEEGVEGENLDRLNEMLSRWEAKLSDAFEFLVAIYRRFPRNDIKEALERINYLLLSSNLGKRFYGTLDELFTPGWVDSFLTEDFTRDVSDLEFWDVYLLPPEENEELRRYLRGQPRSQLLKKEERELTPTEVWERILKGDKETIEDLTKFLAKLFLLFLYDWFNWEIFGWLLAIKLGFTPEQVEKYPELGWFAKAVTSYLLIRSDDDNARLLGRALLYHTEIPPERLYVKVGGDFIPAVVDHYRRSAEHSPIIRDMEKVFKILVEK